MSFCFLAFSSSSGIPILNRKSKKFPNIPFPLQASLFGAQTFCKSVNSSLSTLQCSNHTVTWQEYRNSLTLILILIGEAVVLSHSQRRRVLDLLWDCMLAVVGEEVLTQNDGASVEVIKKRLQKKFSIVVDTVMTDICGSCGTFCGLTGFADVTATRISSKLKRTIEIMAERAHSAFGLLLLNDQLATATPSWNHKQLIVALLMARSQFQEAGSVAEAGAVVCVPMFLSDTGSREPFRLVLFRPCDECCVGVVCGPSPELPRLSEIMHDVWSEMEQPLQKTLLQLAECTSVEGLFSLSQMGILIENLKTRECCRLIRSIPESPVQSEDPNTGVAGNIMDANIKIVCSKLRSLYCSYSSIIDAETDKSEDLMIPFHYEVLDDYCCAVYTEQTHRIYSVFELHEHPLTMREALKSSLYFVLDSKLFRI